MKKLNDLTPFQNVLPYASELFGVYQPLLGWKSRRMRLRFKRGMAVAKNSFYPDLYRNIESKMTFKSENFAGVPKEGGFPKLEGIEVGNLIQRNKENHSFLIDALKKELPCQAEMDDSKWKELLSEEKLQSTLNDIVSTQFDEAYEDVELKRLLRTPEAFHELIVSQAHKESSMAAYLMQLKEADDTAQLEGLFYKSDNKLGSMLQLFKRPDPFEVIDPHNDLGRIVVSPVSIVHIFRQYFFEFDTFLGTPVEHVWLSPGSSVELVETSTRRTLKEKSFESEYEITTKVEQELEELDEISSSVKEENKSNTKFGFNTEVQQGWVGGSAKASSSLNIDKTQTVARETTHRHMKKQTNKLSTEIRKNYKTSFKTVTEVTDTSSKRYLLNNSTDDLINYELRRKMRQVGVQVQDVGTYLCWQTFVDDPGKALGVSELIHIAEPPDLANIPEPESAPTPENIKTEEVLTIPFKPATSDTNDDDRDETYINGKEHDTDTNEGDAEKIKYKFRDNSFACDKSGYRYDRAQFDGQGANLEAVVYGQEDTSEDGRVTFDIKIKQVNFRGADSLPLKVIIHWVPTQQKVTDIEEENAARKDAYNEESKRAHEQAYINAARERIKLASEIKSRKFEDLREEERIVIYRRLLQDMLTKELPLHDNKTRHAVSELLNSIFDFNKMLYFVAPEWWKPKHASYQNLGGFYDPPNTGSTTTTNANAFKSLHSYKLQKTDHKLYPLRRTDSIASKHKVGWGGINQGGRDNYYITEESQPARLGSSLGWLLQLDGDDLRNQFLNAPWVKAVVPIRPGKEKTAFNWLKRLEVEGTDGLTSEYVAPSAELNEIPHSGSKVTIQDAINHLCDKVHQKHKDASKVDAYPTDEINDDNKVNATPIYKVYEHGFYHNKDGFKLDVNEPFEVFDQWIEILPTDQIVPVEVKYDPKTGRQI